MWQMPAPDRYWRNSITRNVRGHLVYNLVRLVYPAASRAHPAAVIDSHMWNLISYTNKLEKVVYETANSSPEYFHLMVWKIYDIQKEHEEKRWKLVEQQIQQKMQEQMQQQIPQPLANTLANAAITGDASGSTASITSNSEGRSNNSEQTTHDQFDPSIFLNT